MITFLTIKQNIFGKDFKFLQKYSSFDEVTQMNNTLVVDKLKHFQLLVLKKFVMVYPSRLIQCLFYQLNIFYFYSASPIFLVEKAYFTAMEGHPFMSRISYYCEMCDLTLPISLSHDDRNLLQENQSRVSYTLRNTSVKISMYGHSITRPGFVILLTIQVMETLDFGEYTVRLGTPDQMQSSLLFSIVRGTLVTFEFGSKTRKSTTSHYSKFLFGRSKH